jgi:hypothetical protein
MVACARRSRDSSRFNFGLGRRAYLRGTRWKALANIGGVSVVKVIGPRPDQALLQRLLGYGIAIGYLRGGRVQRTSG